MCVASLVGDGKGNLTLLARKLLAQDLFSLIDDGLGSCHQLTCRLLQFADELHVAFCLKFVLGLDIRVLVAHLTIYMVAWINLHADDPFALIAILDGCRSQGNRVFLCRLFLHRRKVALVNIVEFQDAVVVAGSLRVEVVDQPKPAAALCEEEFFLILVVPIAPFLGIVVAQQGVTVEDALCFLHILVALPEGDGSVENALVVVGDAEALGIVVYLYVVSVEATIEVRAVLFVVFHVFVHIGAKLLIEFTRCFFYVVEVGRYRLWVLAYLDIHLFLASEFGSGCFHLFE